MTCPICKEDKMILQIDESLGQIWICEACGYEMEVYNK